MHNHHYSGFQSKSEYSYLIIAMAEGEAD